MPNGACFVTTEAFCVSHQGSYHGDGTLCAATTCPAPTGACCLPSGACVVTTAQACAMQMGIYRGNNVLCAATTCRPADLNGWPLPTLAGSLGGRPLNINDVVAFMNAYAAGQADVNGDGVTDARDLSLLMELIRP